MSQQITFSKASFFMREAYCRSPERRRLVLIARRAQVELAKTRTKLGLSAKGGSISDDVIIQNQDRIREAHGKRSIREIVYPSWGEIAAVKTFVVMNQWPLAFVSVALSKLYKSIRSVVTTFRHPAFFSMDKLAEIGERKREAIKAWRAYRAEYGYSKGF